MTQHISTVILAAGQGTRMKSNLPKVLHKVGHKSMLEHVIDCAQCVNSSDIHVVYGHGGETVPQTLSHLQVGWVEQENQLGTGHAVEQVMPHIQDERIVLILYGDVPLTKQDTLQKLIAAADNENLGLLTVKLPDPTGYGRILRNLDNDVIRIVEQKDATDAQKNINEVNTGMMAVPADKLRRWLQKLDNDNAQGEFYLTDIIEMAVAEGLHINTVEPSEIYETLGVNNKIQLAEIERFYQKEQAQRIMTDGVTLRDPARFDLRGELSVGSDVIIDVNVVFTGKVKLGDRVTIGPGCVLSDVEIGDDAVVKEHCVLEKAVIGARVQIGPFARIRPDTTVADDARIGNFVEIKKSELGQGSKVNHLSYIGDAQVGKMVNIGAGTITCNYDGANKFKTVIGDNAFVGSDTQFIAPVTVGAGATIGAGSTITQDTPPGELTLSRAKQTTIKGWKRPVKKK